MFPFTRDKNAVRHPTYVRLHMVRNELHPYTHRHLNGFVCLRLKPHFPAENLDLDVVLVFENEITSTLMRAEQSYGYEEQWKFIILFPINDCK